MIKGHGDDIFQYRNGIRMNFSSNVYGNVSHDGLNAYLCSVISCIRSYPEPEPYSLERLWAEQLDIVDASICVTNGATEAIYLIAQAFRESRSVILMPTFSEYADACRLHSHEIIKAYSFERMDISGCDICWICNPNNPTGKAVDVDELRKMIVNNPGCLFVIDQSYEAFTAVPLLSAKETVMLPNVLLLHSMTKHFAIPGLRLGGVTGNPELINRLKKCKMPWSVNALAISAGHYLLTHHDEFEIDLPALLREKDRVASALEITGEMDVMKSDTHYMLVRLKKGKASELKTFLAVEKGILIRDASNFDGLDERFFRIAVQMPEENDELINCIKEWICIR